MKNIFLKISKQFVFILELIAKLVYRNEKPARVIFICGVPRSGSTFLYQELTNTLKFGYTDNYTQYVTEKSFIGGNIVSEYFLRRAPHNCFKSIHGTTNDCGLCAPNEAGKYWSIARESNNIEHVRGDFQIINAITNKPYIVKNLYTSLMIASISNVLPDARFIHIKRDKVSNVNSLIKARKKLGVLSNEDWSVMPDYEMPFLTEEERVEYQYDEINRIVTQGLKDKRSFEIEYQNFLHNKERYIQDLLNFCFED